LSDNLETIGVTDLAIVATLPRVANDPNSASGAGIYFCSLFSFLFPKSLLTSVHISLFQTVSNFQYHLSSIYDAEPMRKLCYNNLLNWYDSAQCKKII